MRLRARPIAVLLTLMTMAFGFAAADAGAAKAPTAKSSLKALVRQVNSLPPAAASPTKRRALKRFAAHAKRSARRRPCASVNDLKNLRRIIASVPVKSKGVSRKRRRAAQRLSALGPASVNASRLLLASKRTKRCGGGITLPKGDNPKVRVLRSDARRLRVRVQLPAVQFAPREADGQAWTQLVLSNSGTGGAPGTPGIPVVSDILAVPDGAKMKLSVNDVDKILIDGVDVFPAQPDPVDQETEPRPDFLKPPFADLPFQLNDRAYAKDSVVPAKPADVDSLGAMRDLNIGALQIPTAQYNPDSKKLVLLKSVDVTIGFVGGPHTFSDALGDPWEEFQRRLTQVVDQREAASEDRPPRDHPPLRRADGRHHQSLDARRRQHLRGRAQRRGNTHERVPDRNRAGPRRHHRRREIQSLHPHPRQQQPAVHPPELRDDHGRRRPRAHVHGRPERHPVGPQVLAEERHRRTAGPGCRSHPRQ